MMYSFPWASKAGWTYFWTALTTPSRSLLSVAKVAACLTDTINVMSYEKHDTMVQLLIQ